MRRSGGSGSPRSSRSQARVLSATPKRVTARPAASRLSIPRRTRSRPHNTVVRVVKQVFAELKMEIPYKFGTMIEIPRAALTAGEIAKVAEFFSFGTNDLTQTTFGFSRDDAEGKFLLKYVEEKILPVNPFESLDTFGVRPLMNIAVEEGRNARPNMEIAVCSTPGGDPASPRSCHTLGLNYVSCSP